MLQIQHKALTQSVQPHTHTHTHTHTHVYRYPHTHVHETAAFPRKLLTSEILLFQQHKTSCLVEETHRARAVDGRSKACQSFWLTDWCSPLVTVCALAFLLMQRWPLWLIIARVRALDGNARGPRSMCSPPLGSYSDMLWEIVEYFYIQQQEQEQEQEQDCVINHPNDLLCV